MSFITPFLVRDKNIDEDYLIQWINGNSDHIIKEICGGCHPVETRSALFLAGSPGAGKTEIAHSLIKHNPKMSFVHIEQDKIKEMLPGYTGLNAPDYQKPATRGLGKVLKHVMKEGYNFILDTTLSHQQIAHDNIKKAIRKGYKIEVYFVYQDPIHAWNFVRKREQAEGRVVPKESFAKQFVESRVVVNNLKKELGKNIELHIVIKTVDDSGNIVNIKYEFNKESIDNHIKSVYSENQILDLIQSL